MKRPDPVLTVTSTGKSDGIEFDLRRYARLLLKRKWWIVASLIASIAAGVVVTMNSPPVYQVDAKLFVGQRQITVAQLGAGVQVTNLSGRLIQSYREMVGSRAIAQRAIAESGLNVTPGEIQRSLKAEYVLDTQVIKLTYRANDPVLAERVTNAVAKAFSGEISRLEANEEEGTEPAIRVSIIDPAVAPTNPVSPNPARNITLAAALGLVLGVGLAFLVDHLDVTVKNREELEEMGVPVLAAIPALETKGEEVYIERDAQGLGGEAFRKLRTAIGFLGVESPVKTILVTSPFAEEGKTTMALNLACAYALGGFRTLLVEADLRRPSLHRVFGMYGTKGLTTVIVGDVPVQDAILQTETRNLAVLLAGAIPPNPVELLGSVQMADVLEQLKRMFDVVIIDTPPLLPVADPAALAGSCDGVVVVARTGKTDRRKLLDAIQVVNRAGGRLLGVALNFLNPTDSAYEYEYYYGYRSVDRGDKMTSRAGTR